MAGTVPILLDALLAEVLLVRVAREVLPSPPKETKENLLMKTSS